MTIKTTLHKTRRVIEIKKAGKRSGFLVKTRNARVHVSSLMLLALVKDIQDAGRNSQNEVAYIGEICAYYNSETKRQGLGGQYTYGGITQMLRKMEERGFVTHEKHGQYSAYMVTNAGLEALGDVS